MKRVDVTVSGEIQLMFDPESPEFKEALDAYKRCMDSSATAGSMLNHVAFYITRFGVDSMVEGVGYVGYNGRKPSESPYSGIMVGEDYDEMDFSNDYETT